MLPLPPPPLDRPHLNLDHRQVPFYRCNVEGLVEEVSVDFYSGGFEKRMCDYHGARPDLAAVDAACLDKHELTEEEQQLVYAAKARNKRWRRYQL